MNKIYSTEIEYTKCFSYLYEEEKLIRLYDTILPDMYTHNLTYIKNDLSDDEFQDLIKNELVMSTEKGRNFLNVQFDFTFRNSLLNMLEKKPTEISTYDYYVFSLDNLDNLQERADCTLRKLDPSLVEQALKLDLDISEQDMGRDFVTRRFERRSKVYLQSGLVDNYLFFHGEQAVGHCDLFLNGNVAKIEDFDIAPSIQRKGYGTSMLKEIIKIAVSRGAETIYLITDHEDTAKEMYEKCGFKKAGVKTEMLFLGL